MYALVAKNKQLAILQQCPLLLMTPSNANHQASMEPCQDDLQKVKSQQASLFASETSKVIFGSRVRIMEQDEMCSSFFFQKYDMKPSDSGAFLLILFSIYLRRQNTGEAGKAVFSYSALCDLIDNDLLEVYNRILLARGMCKSTRKGIITIVKKQKGEKEKVGNWQPVLLQNADYKILSKEITNQ
eukprot:g27030.t1